MDNGLLIGSLTENYSETEVSNLGLKHGMIYKDKANCKAYIFLKNEGSSAIAAKKAVKVNDASAFAVELNATLNAQFAGVRVPNADSLAENESGWFQVAGNATMVFGDTARATVDGEGVVMDDDADGGNIGGVDLDTSATVNETTVEASLTSIHGMFGIAQAAVSTTDADVEVQLIRNVWGVAN